MSLRLPRAIPLAAAVSLAVCGAADAAGHLDVATAKAEIDARLDRDYPQLEALYRDIHQHPELAFQETRTADRLAKEMRALGFEVTEHVGRTGVVAVYRNGAGPTVMVRTELDALPMEEKTGLAYASHAVQTWNGKPSPVAHSCGHDIHMAAWVGAARQLVAMKSQWRGTLVFIGQPAEEAIGGAKAMLADGLLSRFPKPDIGFAQHVSNEPEGAVYYRPGVYTSNADSFALTFHGRGAHGSRPQLSIDPVMEAARFVVDVQSVVSREKDPAQFGVVTVGSIQTGSAGNIIPDSAVLRGTIRSYDAAVRAKLKDGLQRTARAVAEMSNAPAPVVDFDDSATAVINDAGATARTAAVLRRRSATGPSSWARPIRPVRTIPSSSWPACPRSTGAWEAMIRR